jgi:hypothetical protein
MCIINVVLLVVPSWVPGPDTWFFAYLCVGRSGHLLAFLHLDFSDIVWPHVFTSFGALYCVHDTVRLEIFLVIGVYLKELLGDTQPAQAVVLPFPQTKCYYESLNNSGFEKPGVPKPDSIS